MNVTNSKRPFALLLVCILCVTVNIGCVATATMICSLLAQGFSAAGTLTGCTTLTQIGMAAGAVSSVGSGVSYLANSSGSTTTTEWEPPTDGSCDTGGQPCEDEGQVVPVGFFPDWWPEDMEETEERDQMQVQLVNAKINLAYHTWVKYAGLMPSTSAGIEQALSEMRSALAGVKSAKAQVDGWLANPMSSPLDVGSALRMQENAGEYMVNLQGLIAKYERRLRV